MKSKSIRPVRISLARARKKDIVDVKTLGRNVEGCGGIIIRIEVFCLQDGREGDF